MSTPALLESPTPSYTLAGPGRRLFHSLIALAGWALFVYWWSLVLRRVSQREIDFTFLFVGIALVVVVSLTVGWAVHNFLIFKRRGARNGVRQVREDFSRDTLGRPMVVEAGLDNVRRAAVVRIGLEGESKVYRPASRLPIVIEDFSASAS